MSRPRIVLAISGASGAIYGIQALKLLRGLGTVETHLVISPAGARTIGEETDLTPAEVESLADHCYAFRDIGSPSPAARSPCKACWWRHARHARSAASRSSLGDNLIVRAADVCLKERRRLVLLFRETPLHLGHIELMANVTRFGAIRYAAGTCVLPASHHRRGLATQTRRGRSISSGVSRARAQALARRRSESWRTSIWSLPVIWCSRTASSRTASWRCRTARSPSGAVRRPPPRALDARGQWVMPGVIDGQVHAGSQANQEGLGRASRAAAAGGVTTMVDMPYDDPEPVWHGELWRQVKEVERESSRRCGALCDDFRGRHGTSTIAGLIEAGACGFKFSTFEAAPWTFSAGSTRTCSTKRSRRSPPQGCACGVHNQMQELTRKNIARLIARGGYRLGCVRTRAHAADRASGDRHHLRARRAHRRARARRARLSVARLRALRELPGGRHRTSIETCVQYLMLNGESDMQRLGAKLKHYPPVRPQSEVERLWTHIAAGHCTFVSSDHVSWGLERKSHPNIFKNSSGGPGLENLLPAFWTGCEERGLSPTTVVRMLCDGPARHFLPARSQGVPCCSR